MKALWILLVLMAVTACFYKLGDVPVGFHHDEASVGWNAFSIVHDGTDQYGVRYPLFFRAFGDYKSPVLVYSVALSEAVLGPSRLAVRLPSALFAIASAVVMYFLMAQVTSAQVARWLAVLMLAAPTTLVFARTAFSEVSTLPLFFLLALLAVERCARQGDSKWAALAGVALACTTYTYTTMRLLGPLLLLAAGVCFAANSGTRRNAWVLLGCGVPMLLPYGWYVISHPGALDGRFHTIWILYDNPGLPTALGRFIHHYFVHIGLPFLFWSGAPNPCFNAGHSYLPMYLAMPLAAGVYVLWTRRRDPWCAFLLCAIALSPVPAALCQFEIPHASRMLHFLVLAYLIAAIGIAWAMERFHPSRWVAAALVGVALFETGIGAYRYFVTWPPVTQIALDRGITAALEMAYAHHEPGTKLGLSHNLLWYGGIWVLFVGHYDAAQIHTQGIPDVVEISDKGPSLPAGSILVLPGKQVPAQPAVPLAETDSLADNSPLWKVWQAR